MFQYYNNCIIDIVLELKYYIYNTLLVGFLSSAPLVTDLQTHQASYNFY